MRGRAGRLCLVGAAILAGGIFSCERREPLASREFRRAPVSPASSLLLVTLDTFRADAAGSGGNPDGRTPHLDRIGRSGVQFETALAGSPLTLPSHACMLTGRNGPAHGIRDNGTYRLPDGIPTLPQALAERGFATGAFVAAFPLAARFGLDRGFDVYDDAVGDPSGEGGLVMAQRSGAEVARAAASWWRQRPGRWFAWVHLFDAHSPHDAPRPLIEAARGDPYLADVALTDLHLGSVLKAARELGDEHWVFLLGDHGESRGEHGEMTHGLFVYDSTIRIPAAIWPAPAGKAAGLTRGFLRTIDLPATAFELLGLPPEDAPGDGTSALSGEGSPAYMESWFAYLHYGWSRLEAIQVPGWKYIEAPEPELYRLELDPGEEHNVAADHPDRVDTMSGWIREITDEEAGAEALALDDAARDALESLGYVTGAAPGRTDSPDPKRMIGVQRLLEAAQGLISAGRWEEAFSPLRSALARDPRNKDVHLTLGLVHGAAGRHAEAANSFLRCLELPPHTNDRVPRFELARSYLQSGKPAEAARHLEIILRVFPNDTESWYNLGVAREREGRRREAEEAWEMALQADPGNSLALRALGRPLPGSRDAGD